MEEEGERGMNATITLMILYISTWALLFLLFLREGGGREGGSTDLL